jgi:3-hydroxyacyl-CoA dehydrogenase/enoyl-CoA hydratase/3-hydroxybutyryl-CoA epimerase
MYESEATQVADLLLGPSARNLIRVFQLRERLKAEGKRSDFTANWVHVVGAGTMGGDIAAWCALQGLRVSLQDQTAVSLGQALARARKLFERRLREPRLVRAAADRLMPDHRGAGLARADLVIEAVFEDAEVKRNLFRQLESRVRPDCLLASNTSTIPLQEVGRYLSDPGRLVGLHFFNPVARMQLVEVVSAEATDPQAAARAAAFTRGIGRLPLPVRSQSGFLVNRVLMPYLLGAVQRLEEGVPAAAIDGAAREFGMPMGPLELADRVGLDVCLAAARNLAETFPVQMPALLVEQVDAGRLGRKSGRGFYRYRNGRPLPERPPWGYRASPALMEQLLQPLLDEASACLQAGIVADADLLDAGLVFGAGFAPFTGGPMHYLGHGGRLQLHRHQVGPATGLGEPMGATMG